MTVKSNHQILIKKQKAWKKHLAVLHSYTNITYKHEMKQFE